MTGPSAYERLVDRLLASPALRRALGAALARPGPLRRVRRLPPGRLSARRLALSRLRHPVASTPTSPTTASSPSSSPATSSPPTTPSCGSPPATSGSGPTSTTSATSRGQWADILNDITDVTGEVFLGLSIGCARCHDHKFDPILQKDYYRLQAFFTPLLPRDDLTLATAAAVGRLPGATAPPGRRRRPTSCARSTRSSGPTATRGPPSAIAKFPDDIKAILRQARAGSDAAGAAARRPGLSPGRLRARRRSRRAQGAGQGPVGRAAEAARAVSTP